jgi:hypothetical protein
MTAETLARVMDEFLGGSRNAVVLEDGARIFDLQDSKYSISGEYNKCLLHLWSSERNVVRRLRAVRGPHGARHQPLWRLHPVRWLESLVLHDVSTLDERPEGACLYSQVPAFSAPDRAMLDVLTTTRDRRLAVIELKADEDIHLPLQGLDYWSRVQWHHARGEFAEFGYFSGRELSAEDPLLLLVAPTLHIHPATDTVLRYIDSSIDWTRIGIDERWRDRVRVIFRKRQACGVRSLAPTVGVA